MQAAACSCRSSVTGRRALRRWPACEVSTRTASHHAPAHCLPAGLFVCPTSRHATACYTASRALPGDTTSEGENERLPPAANPGDLDLLDANQLQTALIAAINSEDYVLAKRVRDQLDKLVGSDAPALADWRKLGIADWLAERAEQLGFKFPTEVQRRAALVLADGADCIIQSQTGSGKTLAFVLPALSRLDYPPHTYPDDLRGPQCVVLVPSLELGVQVTMLIYRLYGGNVNPGIPGNPANIFAYSGPRGIKVKGVLDKEGVILAKNTNYLAATHVVVATPDCLAEVLGPPQPLPLLDHLKFLLLDEVDACFQAHGEVMEALMTTACSRSSKPVVAFAGATVQEGVAATAVDMGWMVDPVTVTVGRLNAVPSGLQHRYLVVEGGRKLVVLSRQIRQDLRSEGEDAAPARMMVFAGSEGEAREVASPLRRVLWGDHKMTVLLPGGEEPITALHSFRDNKASLMLATPAAARGLDLPAVGYVYNTAPPQDATDYLHRAGRAGRIGSPVKGIITTLVALEEVQPLLQMAEELGIQMTEIQEPEVPAAEGDVDSLKQGLEDLYNLL